MIIKLIIIIFAILSVRLSLNYVMLLELEGEGVGLALRCDKRRRGKVAKRCVTLEVNSFYKLIDNC